MKALSLKQLVNNLQRKKEKLKRLEVELKSEKATIAKLTKQISDGKKKEAAAKAKVKVAKAKKGKAKPKAKAKAKKR